MISPNVTQIGKLNQPEKMKKIETDKSYLQRKYDMETNDSSHFYSLQCEYKLDLVEKHFATTCKSEKIPAQF